MECYQLNLYQTELLTHRNGMCVLQAFIQVEHSSTVWRGLVWRRVEWGGGKDIVKWKETTNGGR